MKRKTAPVPPTFASLVSAIQSVDHELAAQAGRAVNVALTLRNWLIGGHIAEYELKGADRAKYGDKLIDSLAAELTRQGVSRCDRRELYRYRTFYLAYPGIVESLTPQFGRRAVAAGRLRSAGQTAIVESLTPELPAKTSELVSKLSFTHISELLNVEDQAARAFYESECLRGGWSVRELKRQIASLYWERSALSRNKKKLATQAHRGAEQATARLDVKDPYVFEFLGLKPHEVMSESHLEDQLLDRLQDFLLELGHGFCFEARQKRILIGDSHGFVDLVFYHRILKCHVLVDLKLEPFTHENIGQLNTYVTWYRRHIMQKGDNPPVGLLLCAQKDHTLAEYALAGMDNKLFVSKYQLHLPKPTHLQRRLQQAIRETAP